MELSREGTNSHGFWPAFHLFDHGLCVIRVFFSSCYPKETYHTKLWIERQGNPSSPYLFFLCTEGLISLLIENQRVKGLKIYRRAPVVNHLLFVDDSMFFYKADVDTYRGGAAATPRM